MHGSFFMVVRCRDVVPALLVIFRPSTGTSVPSVPSLHRSYLFPFLPFYLLPFFSPPYLFKDTLPDAPAVPSLRFVFHESTWPPFPVTFSLSFLRVSFHSLSRAPSVLSVKIISRADGTRKWNCTGTPENVGCLTVSLVTRDLFRVKGNYTKYICA